MGWLGVDRFYLGYVASGILKAAYHMLWGVGFAASTVDQMWPVVGAATGNERTEMRWLHKIRQGYQLVWGWRQAMSGPKCAGYSIDPAVLAGA
ncbi:MAG: NINE protein [Acidimicrobiaceae bacterium]|nr:NINE protein [Acidimicrobiaceae bacterium]